MKEKRSLRLGDASIKTCKNSEVGDRRFAENYFCDYKQKLRDRECEMAYKMSRAQFRDSTSEDEIEDKCGDERDMGDNKSMEIVQYR